MVTSAGRLGSFSTRGSDSPARVRNRLAIWPSALKTSSFLAADACSWSRISPVRQFLARKPNTYWLPRLVIEPSTTAALPVRSQISAATSGVSFASVGRTIRRQRLAHARIRKQTENTATVSSSTDIPWRSVSSNTGSPVLFSKSARTMVSFVGQLGSRRGESRCTSDQTVTPLNTMNASPAAVAEGGQPVPAKKLARPVQAARRRGQHGPVLHVPLDIGGERQPPKRSAARALSPEPSS